MKWLRNLWWAYTRWADVYLLWSSCKKVTKDAGYPISKAREVFYYHCSREPAWCEFYDTIKLKQVINELE